MKLTLFPKREKEINKTLKIINRKIEIPDYFNDYGKLLAYHLIFLGVLEENDAFDEDYEFISNDNEILCVINEIQTDLLSDIDEYEPESIEEWKGILSIKELDWIDENVICPGHGNNKDSGRGFITGRMNSIDFFLTYQTEESKKRFFTKKFEFEKSLYGYVQCTPWYKILLEKSKLEIKEENIIPLSEVIADDTWVNVCNHITWAFENASDVVWALKLGYLK